MDRSARSLEKVAAEWIKAVYFRARTASNRIARREAPLFTRCAQTGSNTSDSVRNFCYNLQHCCTPSGGAVAPAPMPGLNSPKYIFELRFSRSFKRRFRTVTIAKGNGEKKMCRFFFFPPLSRLVDWNVLVRICAFYTRFDQFLINNSFSRGRNIVSRSSHIYALSR